MVSLDGWVFMHHVVLGGKPGNFASVLTVIDTILDRQLADNLRILVRR